MAEPASDFDGFFDEDYLYFFAEGLDEIADAEADLIWRLLELEPSMEVLDLACGHGRIVNRLAEKGCHVTGLDASPLFLGHAREDAARRGVKPSYVAGDVRSLPWSGRFDRVINWFNAFGYLDDRDDRRVLSEVHRALKPGGRMALQMDYRDHVLRHFQAAGVFERAGDLAIDRRRYEPLTGRAVMTRTVIRDGRIRQIPFSVRLFTFTELRDWLLDAGFAAVTGHDADGGPLNAASRQMITVARR